MNEQNRPASDELAPDPATVYERAKPEKECGMGRLDNNKGTPTKCADAIHHATPNKQNPENQINGEDVVDASSHRNLHGRENK